MSLPISSDVHPFRRISEDPGPARIRSLVFELAVYGDVGDSNLNALQLQVERPLCLNCRRTIRVAHHMAAVHAQDYMPERIPI